MAATTGYQTRSFAEAAKRLGIELVLATDRCHVLDDPWGDLAVPVRFEHPEEAVGALSSRKFQGIVAVGDRPARLAAAVAGELGIPFHTADSVAAASDKSAARRLFAAAALPVPLYYQFPLDRAPDAADFYPCVVKPLGLSASRGVIRANNGAEFRNACGRIRRILETPEIRRLGDPRDRLIQVESFLPGKEFALEGLVSAGKLQTLAIFAKPDPLDGPFFEETIYVTPPRDVDETALTGAVRRAVAALGLTQGPIHAEMRVNSSGIYMLEVAARPIGGLCSRALRFRHGKSLEELILLHATGDTVPEGLAQPGGVIMIPIPCGGIYEGFAGAEDALAVPGITDLTITAKVGQELVPLPEGASYLGFLFAEGTHAEAALREAHARLAFSIATVLPVRP